MGIITMFKDYSINSDEYGAANLAHVFRSLFGAAANSGPLKGALNELFVSHVSGRTVQVATGQGLIRGWWFEVYSSFQLALPENDSSYDRIDRVVARLTFDVQNVSLTAVIGTPAASPVAPSLVQNTTYWDVPLASTTMNASDLVTNIVDTREFCEFANQPPHQHWYFMDSASIVAAINIPRGGSQEFDLTAHGVPANSEAAYVYVWASGVGWTDDWYLSFYAGPEDNDYLIGTFRIHFTQGFRQLMVVPLRNGTFGIAPIGTTGSVMGEVRLLAYRVT